MAKYLVLALILAVAGILAAVLGPGKSDTATTVSSPEGRGETPAKTNDDRPVIDRRSMGLGAGALKPGELAKVGDEQLEPDLSEFYEKVRLKDPNRTYGWQRLEALKYRKKIVDNHLQALQQEREHLAGIEDPPERVTKRLRELPEQEKHFQKLADEWQDRIDDFDYQSSLKKTTEEMEAEELEMFDGEGLAPQDALAFSVSDLVKADPTLSSLSASELQAQLDLITSALEGFEIPEGGLGELQIEVLRLARGLVNPIQNSDPAAYQKMLEVRRNIVVRVAKSLAARGEPSNEPVEPHEPN